jgi:hypothetical protein
MEQQVRQWSDSNDNHTAFEELVRATQSLENMGDNRKIFHKGDEGTPSGVEDQEINLRIAD